VDTAVAPIAEPLLVNEIAEMEMMEDGEGNRLMEEEELRSSMCWVS